MQAPEEMQRWSALTAYLRAQQAASISCRRRFETLTRFEISTASTYDCIKPLGKLLRGLCRPVIGKQPTVQEHD